MWLPYIITNRPPLWSISSHKCCELFEWLFLCPISFSLIHVAQSLFSSVFITPASLPILRFISSNLLSIYNHFNLFILLYTHYFQSYPSDCLALYHIVINMCYQITERYAVCRCLYYQHAVDMCAAYGQYGHPVQERTILVGYLCPAHSPSSSSHSRHSHHHRSRR